MVCPVYAHSRLGVFPNSPFGNAAAVESHHLSAHCAFCWTKGTVLILIARRRCIFFVGRGVLDIRVDEERVPLAVNVFDGNLEAIAASGSSDVTSVAKLLRRFSLTMPSEAAKKARTCRMKCCSVVKSLSQSVALAARSISSAVQMDASEFLYILQMSLCWMEKRMKRWGFAWRSGSAASSPVVSQRTKIVEVTNYQRSKSGRS